MPSALNSRQCWRLRYSCALPRLLISSLTFVNASSPEKQATSRSTPLPSKFSVVPNHLTRTPIRLCACKPIDCASAWPIITAAEGPDTRYKSPFRSGNTFPCSRECRFQTPCLFPPQKSSPQRLVFYARTRGSFLRRLFFAPSSASCSFALASTQNLKPSRLVPNR